MTSPHVVIIAGPNGAGKSTVAPWLLREHFGITRYVNADTIAAGLSGYDPGSVALHAARLMWMRLRELAEQEHSFAFETTLASRSFAPWLKDLKGRGYRVALIFLWLESPETAIGRVNDRVELDGHDIAEEVVRRRYHAGLRNLWELYWPLLDEAYVFHNGGFGVPVLVARRPAGGSLEVANAAIWELMRGSQG